MSTPLPEKPSLRQLQIQAKEFAKALKQSLPEAIARLRRHHPQYSKVEDGHFSATLLKLHDSQLVIAREYGFESWPKLREAIDRASLRSLVNAVQYGDTDRARSILRQNPKLVNLDMSETDEHRVIHFAVLRRDEPMVRVLMRAGADARKGIYPFRDPTAAYVFAVERGFAEIAAAIEQEEQFRRKDLSCPNATVSSAQDDLNDRIRKREYNQAIAILEADPALTNACDRDGGTPLHIACEEGALPVIDWLLDHHANPRKKNLKGCTPLEAAVLRVGWKERAQAGSFPEAARRLLSRGAIMSPLVAAALGDLEELRLADKLDPKGLREVHMLYRGGPLSVAVTFAKPKALELLLKLGLDPNERHRLPDLEEEVYSEGQPLWLAAGFEEYEMAKLLLEHGANASGQVYASGTPVNRAYGSRNARMIQLLVEHGGQPEPSLIGAQRDISAAQELLSRDESENSLHDLLWGAACGGSPEIVTMCLAKLDWQPTNARWYSILVGPLSLMNHAPHSDHPEVFDRSTYPECLKLLLRHGVDVNIRGRKGETLMHCIMAAGRIWGREVMTDAERLQFAITALEAAPDLTLRDDLLKSTPLGWACRWGREELASLLLAHGAMALEPDAEDWATPLAWAEKMGHAGISALLRENMSPVK